MNDTLNMRGVRLEDATGQRWIVVNERVWAKLITRPTVLRDGSIDARYYVVVDTVQAQLQLMESRRSRRQWKYFGGFAGNARWSAKYIKDNLEEQELHDDDVAMFESLVKVGVPTERDHPKYPNCRMHRLKGYVNWNNVEWGSITKEMHTLGPCYASFECNASFSLIGQSNKLCGPCDRDERPLFKVEGSSTDASQGVKPFPAMLLGYGYCIKEDDHTALNGYGVVRTSSTAEQVEPMTGRITANKLLAAFTPCLM